MKNALLEKLQGNMIISRAAPALTVRARYCLYARKSSEEDERQALSIDSQIKEMLMLAKRDGLEISEIRRESHSAKESGARPIFKQLLEDIDKGLFDAILTWAPDRLSRNAGDLGKLVDMMDQGKLIDIRTHGQRFTNSPNEKFLLMILCSQAKLENDNRGINVKRGLRTKCEMGIRPGGVPLGYKLVRSQNFREPSKMVIDEDRAPFIKKMFKYVLEGHSGRQVYEFLTDEGFRTKRGKKLSLSMIYRMYKEPFYYGEFEYPRNSKNWYKGSYPPLITKDEFEKVNKALQVADKGVWGRKEFYFKKIFKCGSCGSGISGEERINRHNKLYVYYKCNKYGGRRVCREKYIREEKLIESLAKIVDQIKEKHKSLSRRLKDEVEKFNNLQKMIAKGADIKILSVKDYIEYILKNGSNQEKSCLLRYIDKQFYLKDGNITLLS
jgi:DNA invertase Pin-like site-specific DNA recombinase